MTDKKISELTSVSPANSTALIPVALSGANYAYTAQAIANLAAGTTPQSLSKVDDTNVTLTLGGNPTSALVNSVTITAGWTGLLAAARGGTSVASFQAGGMTALRVYTFPDAAANVAALNIEDQVVSGGGVVISKSLTTGNITIDGGARPCQYITNNGAFTITAPASDCSTLLLITNSTSASTVTFSNFSVPSSTGDALTVTSTHKFTVHIWRINGTAGYRIAAHQ